MAMPISVQPDQAPLYGDNEHWQHVMETLFQPALEQAGFEPIPPLAQGAEIIHSGIIRHLSTAELVLVDLSSHNPNVFFELGVRTSLNLPVALVADEHTKLPFDTSGINTLRYDSRLQGWEVAKQIANLRRHVEASWDSCAGENPLWRHFGLTLKASEPTSAKDPLTARVDLLAEGVSQVQDKIDMVLTEVLSRQGLSSELAAPVAAAMTNRHSSNETTFGTMKSYRTLHRLDGLTKVE